MSSPKFEITNPQAIELINKLKSGQALIPFKQFIFKWRWLLIGTVVLFSLLIAISIGKALSRENNPAFSPPRLEDISVTPTKTKKSNLDGLKRQLIDFGVGMPDPALPVLDNNISLEPIVLE